jgi:hypothetical protein
MGIVADWNGSWHLPTSPATGGRRPWRERTFFEKAWKFRDAGKGKTEVLPADNYEFPFDIILPGSLPESIEGLSDSWITYRFKAEIGRKYAKDVIARKPLRIIRTLDPSALELAHAMVRIMAGSLLEDISNTSFSRLRMSGQTRSNTLSAQPAKL